MMKPLLTLTVKMSLKLLLEVLMMLVISGMIFVRTGLNCTLILEEGSKYDD